LSRKRRSRPCHHRGSEDQLEPRRHLARLEIALKAVACRRPLLEVDHVHGAAEVRPAEVDDRPGLAHLAGAAHEQGAAVGSVFPCEKLFCYESANWLMLALEEEEGKASQEP
jgi:hypothetical protein